MPDNVETGLAEGKPIRLGLAGCLRARPERPRRRATEQRYELAPFHCRCLPCFQQKG